MTTPTNRDRYILYPLDQAGNRKRKHCVPNQIPLEYQFYFIINFIYALNTLVEKIPKIGRNVTVIVKNRV